MRLAESLFRIPAYSVVGMGHGVDHASSALHFNSQSTRPRKERRERSCFFKKTFFNFFFFWISCCCCCWLLTTFSHPRHPPFQIQPGIHHTLFARDGVPVLVECIHHGDSVLCRASPWLKLRGKRTKWKEKKNM